MGRDGNPNTAVRVRAGSTADVPRLAEVSRAAFTLFSTAGIELPPDDPAEDLASADWVLVAEVDTAAAGVAVGFAQLTELDGHAHLQELSVDPRYGRRGIGTSLVESAVAQCAERGYRRMTLTTFRDVPFNAPWYSRLGFVELPAAAWGPQLAAQWSLEAAAGLLVAPRVVLCRELGGASGAGSGPAIPG